LGIPRDLLTAYVRIFMDRDSPIANQLSANLKFESADPAL